MKVKSITVVAVYMAICVGCISRAGQPAVASVRPLPKTQTDVSYGEASFYGTKDGLARKKTASGEPYNPNALTAAHRSLPLGSMVRVTNEHNGKQVVVRINDRGPFQANRVIDVSPRAASLLDFKKEGVAHVKLEPITTE